MSLPVTPGGTYEQFGRKTGDNLDIDPVRHWAISGCLLVQGEDKADGLMRVVIATSPHTNEGRRRDVLSSVSGGRP